MNDYVIYTDGAYSPKFDIGGIGFEIYKNGNKVAQFSKAYKHTTNQRMELMACILALSCFKNRSNIQLYTDSMYIVGTMTKNWKRKVNLDLWQKLDNLIDKHNIEFFHIKGHDGNERNEIVDRLARQAVQSCGGHC